MEEEQLDTRRKGDQTTSIEAKWTMKQPLTA